MFYAIHPSTEKSNRNHCTAQVLLLAQKVKQDNIYEKILKRTRANCWWNAKMVPSLWSNTQKNYRGIYPLIPTIHRQKHENTNAQSCVLQQYSNSKNAKETGDIPDDHQRRTIWIIIAQSHNRASDKKGMKSISSSYYRLISRIYCTWRKQGGEKHMFSFT